MSDLTVEETNQGRSLVEALERGRISRRGFIVRAAALGFSATTIGGILSACGQAAAPGAQDQQPTGDLTIAYQPGIGYAQLIVAKQKKLLETALPQMKVTYTELASGAAIRDGMLAGKIQVGSGGVGPFLVGWDKGVGWKLLSALNQMDLWLMVKDEKYKSLKGFAAGDKIAMPAADSIQSVVLRKGAQQQLGDARKLDQNIVSMPHPDGLQALISGQIAGHLTSPPFQFQEQEQGARKILSSYDLFGPSTFNSVFVTQKYHDANPRVMEAVAGAIQQGTDMAKNDPDQVADLLSKESGGKTSAEKFKGYITAQGVEYTTEPNGFVKYAEFMKEIGLIDKTPTFQDLVFPNLKTGS